MDREIKIEDNEKYFKSGIGDLEDLKVLDDYSRKHEEDFEVDLTLSGKTLENDTFYPKLDVDYEVKASGTRKVERTTDPADYNFDVLYEPNFKAYYRLKSFDPIFDTEIDNVDKRTSIKKSEGNKKRVNSRRHKLNLKQEGYDLLSSGEDGYCRNFSFLCPQIYRL